MSTHRILLAAALCLGFHTAPSFSQDVSQCSDVLEEHLLTRSEINVFSDTQYIYTSDIASMSYGEFKDKVDTGITVPIEGFPVSGNFSRDQFEQWKNEYRESVNVSDIQTHRTHILLSSANPLALRAWESCMLSRSAGGVYLYLEPISRTTFTLRVFARPETFQQTPPVIEGTYIEEGSRIVSGAEFFQSGSVLSTDRIVTIKRGDEKSDVLITINTTRGPAQAFAVGQRPIPPWPQSARAISFYYNNNYAANIFREIASPPEGSKPVLHVAGLVSSGPIIAGGPNGDRLWYMNDYNSGRWRRIIESPFPVAGLAGENGSGPLIFGGDDLKSVAYLRSYGSQEWIEVSAPAPVRIRQIVGHNANGPIILGTDGRSIFRLNDYSRPAWIAVAPPPFRAAKIAGYGSTGIVACGGPNNRSCAYMRSWSENRWRNLRRAPESVAILMGSASTGPMFVNERGNRFYMIRDYSNPQWEVRSIPAGGAVLAIGLNDGVLVGIPR